VRVDAGSAGTHLSVGCVGCVDGPSLDDRVQYPVGDLISRFLEPRGIAPLARVSDPLPDGRHEQPCTRDDRRQRLELLWQLGVQGPQALIHYLLRGAAERFDECHDGVEGIGASVDGPRQAGIEAGFGGGGWIVASSRDQQVGDAPR